MGGGFKSDTSRGQFPKFEYRLVRNFGPQAERIRRRSASMLSTDDPIVPSLVKRLIVLHHGAMLSDGPPA
jgi:hypothetical protein